MKKCAVLIDNEKIKYPNTGLFSFCVELTAAIESVKDEYALDTTYLIKERSKKDLPGVKHRFIKYIDKHFFSAGAGVDAYHATFQFDSFMPRRTPSVLTIHDLNFLYEKVGKPKKLRKYRRWVQRNIDKADYLVAISEFAKSDVLKHLDVKGKPFDVIYNGCSFYGGEKIENPSYKPSSKFIFSVGTVLAKKNFHTLPTLLVGNDYELVIAGRLSDYTDVIEAEARQFGVESRVHIIGEITEAEKDWYYRNCTAFAFPSIAEGFGLPLIEAMSYGKPTFISRHTSLPEIGRDYSFYFNYEFDRELMRKEFEDGMAKFAECDAQRQIDYARSYSWENAARAYCQIYKKLATK